MDKRNAQRLVRRLERQGLVDIQIRTWAEYKGRPDQLREVYTYDVVGTDPLTGYSKTYA